MRILLTTNKTLSNGKSTWVDGHYYNIYLPLKDLGHEVLFWDTVNDAEHNYQKVVNSFKPDLIFCCLTGDLGIAPLEAIALEAIMKITQKGNIKTFNWFCDDTWRYDNWSKELCKHFTVCSTSEPEYLDIYKQNGYDNILLGGWHTNHTFYPSEQNEKKYDVSFIGHLYSNERMSYIRSLQENNIDVKIFSGLTHEEMLKVLCQSKIGINFSTNSNSERFGLPRTTQMKLRPFEIAAANDTLVVSEYHDGTSTFFDINKEIICFENRDEMNKKIKFLLNKEKIRSNIAKNGNKRFIKDHTSHIRMSNIIEEINLI
jgi:spore maturation protein CgeB